MSGSHPRIVAGAAAALVLGAVALAFWIRRGTTEPAVTEVGAPELYARPIVADVNGDGVEDTIVVTVIAATVLVQAIDGNDGHLFWSIPQGPAYSGSGSERVILVTTGQRLGVARIPGAGRGTLTVHELADGKEVGTLELPPSTGQACQNQGGSAKSPKGTFWFEATSGGTNVDLTRATIAPGQSSCADNATPNVADVPVAAITDRTTWSARFARETELRARSSPYGKRDVILCAGLAMFLDGNPRDQVIALDLATGATRFARSMESIGLSSSVVDHLESTDVGPLLFFEGTRGLAVLDGKTGDKIWSLALPKDCRLSSYTLSKTRAYLHVFGGESNKLGSRMLVVDLKTGTYVRSLPAGSLQPEY